MTPFFSIIIPVYNVAPYLRTCLDSVLAAEKVLRQSQDAHVGKLGVEVICIDDGSTDGSGEILDEYAGRKTATDDSRFAIKVIHQENAGGGAARNAGLDCAKGEYLLFVDSDDAIVPEMMGFLAGELLVSHLDILKFGHVDTDCQTWAVDAQPFPVTQYNLTCESEVVPGFDALGTVFLWQAAFRRQTYTALRMDEHLWPGEDVIYTVEAVALAKKIGVTATVLYKYYHRLGSCMNSGVKSLRHIRSSAESNYRYCKIMQGWWAYGKVRSRVFKRFRTTFIGQGGLALGRVAPEDAKEAWKTYSKGGRRIINDFSDVVPMSGRWVYKFVFSSGMHWLWYLFLFLPWRVRVWLLKSSLVRKLKQIIRG